MTCIQHEGTSIQTVLIVCRAHWAHVVPVPGQSCRQEDYARGTTSFVLAKVWCACTCTHCQCLALDSPGFRVQVATDELIWGPLHVASFFAYMTAVQGGSWQVHVLIRQLACARLELLHFKPCTP